MLGPYRVSGETTVYAHRMYRDLLHVVALRPTKAMGPCRGIDKMIDMLKKLACENIGRDSDLHYLSLNYSFTVALCS